MARIQITDLTPSDYGLMEDITEEEFLVINGSGWKWYKIIAVAGLTWAAVRTVGSLI
jgi:hypothetical protein